MNFPKLGKSTRRGKPSLVLLVFVTLRIHCLMCQNIGCIFLRDDQSIRCQNTSLMEVGQSLHILTIVVNNQPKIIDIDYCGDSKELYPIFDQINASIDTVRIRRSNLETVREETFRPLSESLKDLDLSHNFLSTVPEALKYLEFLEHLNLQHNRIVFLRPSAVFDGLPNLRELNLANNFIGLADEMIDNMTRNYGYQLKAILRLQDFSLGQATRSLESLNLSGNRLASVPVLVTNHTFPELRHIDLSENVIGKLSSISSALMPKLEFLDVRGNRIQSLPFYSLPLTLRYLDLTENPFYCNCGALWLYDWYSTNGTTIRLPACNNPEKFKSVQLEMVPWAALCSDNSSSMSVQSMAKGYRENDMIQLVSSAATVSVSWKAKFEEANKKWTVVYRKANDSPYQMTMGSPSESGGGGGKPRQGRDTILTDKILGLQPSTMYIVCIAVIQDGKYTIEPNRCQNVKTKSYQEVGEFSKEGGSPNDVSDHNTKLAINDIKTEFEDVSVSTDSITVKWRLVASAALTESLEDGALRHEWTLRIRRTGSDNYTDIPVFDITRGKIGAGRDTEEQMYEYSISDLASRTHYDVCLVDVDHRPLSDTTNTLQTVDRRTENETATTTCRTVVTDGLYILYAAEIIAISVACGICLIVIVVTVYLCRQKRLLRWKPKNLRDFMRSVVHNERPQPIGCSNKYAPASIPRVKYPHKVVPVPQNNDSKSSVGTWNTLRMPYKEFPQVDQSEFGYRTASTYKEALSSVTIYSSGHSEC